MPRLEVGPLKEVTDIDYRDLTADRLKAMNLTRERLAEIMRQKEIREATAPQVGDPAPGFRLEKLTPSGARSGEFLDFESLRGKPVALIFGSYT